MLCLLTVSAMNTGMRSLFEVSRIWVEFFWLGFVDAYHFRVSNLS